MTSNPQPNEILNQIAQIQRMVRGKLCVLRHGPKGPYHNCQSWEEGKNRSRYVSADQLTAYEEGLAGYQRSLQLTGLYAEQIIARTHAELEAGKKNACGCGSHPPRPRARNPTTDRSIRRARTDRDGGAGVGEVGAHGPLSFRQGSGRKNSSRKPVRKQAARPDPKPWKSNCTVLCTTCNA